MLSTPFFRPSFLSTTIFSLRFFSSSSLSLLNQHSQTLPNIITENPTTLQNHHQWNHFQKQEHLFSLLQSCSSSTHLLQLHTQFIRTQFIQHPRLSLKFLARVVKICVSNIGYLYRIFTHITAPTLRHYNTMIRAFSISDFSDYGFKLYRRMKRQGFVSNHLTFSFCFDCCVNDCGLIEGLQVHGRVLVDGYGSDCVLMTSMMKFYSIHGRCDEACKVFDEMPKRDVVAYNGLISCFMDNKRTRDVLAVFESMQTLVRDCRPDDVTCLLLLQVCGYLGELEFGRRVGNYMEKHGYGESMTLNNALIVMYSNCGSVDEAYRTFKKMRTKDLALWSSMIEGLGRNGHGKHAVELFWEMIRIGIAPDEKAMTAVLYACGHSGLLEEGLMFFEQMTNKFGIFPTIHHYGCVVDILGRLGSLNQAYDLILSMKIKADVKIWRTLLKACRMHKNFGLAERVIEHIVELKAEEAEDYVLLLNTYLTNGVWHKVIQLKNFLKEKGYSTACGCSTIQLKGVVHEFVIDDVSHPYKDEIYEMLSEILKQLKIAGYVPELPLKLHDMDVLKMENPVSYHSEKLAIAFGVLSTPPSSTIKVANTVAICGDCHNFAKVFSGVYNRKVIIRDGNRIHHFREGKCSCGDCW